ncbi:VPLPA-CTERM sorting domain-containing protein [Pseudoduganella sp. RAF53_2]|uniref:VPLPA-CTERM sorting domain-containing protein n=1 Tax=unclassified Pseudoduganella TaxID=2637179 RepID=UPI003F954073
MNKLIGAGCLLGTLFAAQSAYAGGISDVGVNGYWGADDHGKGDVIGASTYDIQGANITRVGSILTITIQTSFAGHAGMDTWAAPKGIGYGDVFLSQLWNPYGTDSHHLSDDSTNGTTWKYAFSLGDRWSNTGGSFELYQLKGNSNAKDIKTSDSYITCTSCDYRDDQAVGVNLSSTTAKDTGLSGKWTVLADKSLTFTIDISKNMDLMSYTSFAMHWGETCQNDVIEGVTRVVPVPGGLPLMAIGLGALITLRKREKKAAAARG